LSRRSQQRAQRGNIHDASAALADHRGQHGLAAVKNAVEVGRQHAPPRIGRHRGQQRVFVAAGVVDEHVEALMAC